MARNDVRMTDGQTNGRRINVRTHGLFFNDSTTVRGKAIARERCSSASVRNTCDRAPLSEKAINKMAAPFCLRTNVRNKRKIKTVLMPAVKTSALHQVLGPLARPSAWLCLQLGSRVCS